MDGLVGRSQMDGRAILCLVRRQKKKKKKKRWPCVWLDLQERIEIVSHIFFSV
jgi:hypothetical protein